MPVILSSALIEREGRVLLARRDPERPPFARHWLLPSTVVRREESAEEALARHLQHELDLSMGEPIFAETIYLEDLPARERYVTNVFRIAPPPGELRFRAHGDYDDLRWLSPRELAELSIPGPMREWLLALLEPQAQPAPRSDLQAAWNAVAAVQAGHRLSTDAVHYGPRMPTEDDLHLLGDVRGKRVLEIGCGGGQNSIALARRGAIAAGTDPSDQQLAHARELAAREGVQARFYQSSLDDLSDFADGGQDVVLSTYALGYVEDIDRCLHEVFRVLKPGGIFVFSSDHPIMSVLSQEGPPWVVRRSYWDASQQRQQQGIERPPGMMAHYRPLGDWFQRLVEAGFLVERLLEPPPAERKDLPTSDYPLDKLKMIPATVIFKARKPA